MLIVSSSAKKALQELTPYHDRRSIRNKIKNAFYQRRRLKVVNEVRKLYLSGHTVYRLKKLYKGRGFNIRSICKNVSYKSIEYAEQLKKRVSKSG